ncbi:MAG: hypothetical protein J5U19_16120 [Candidatus Methanoperedens sp.]|nr:hypothetical protein [Candidatus Methanoperedens sp.]
MHKLISIRRLKISIENRPKTRGNMYSGNSITWDETNLDIIPKISFILKVDREKLERDSMKTYLHIKLMRCEAEIFNLAKKYGISSVEDFENKYTRGELEEEGTWEDFFKLDHLEAEKDSLKKALEVI